MEPTKTVVTSDGVYEFLRMLVEIGGVHKVDKDGNILHADGTPIHTEVGHNHKKRQYRILNKNMHTGDYVYVNPLNEAIKTSSDRVWFWGSRTAILSSMIKYSLIKLIRLSLADEVPLELMELSKALGADRLDEAAADHIDKIDEADIFTIFYDVKEHIAQVQCRVLEDEWRKEVKKLSCMRKKDWDIVASFLNALLGEPPHAITHRGEVTAIFEADARLNVIIQVLDRIEPIVRILLDVDIPLDAIKSHYENLDTYRKAVAWYASANKPAKVETPEAKRPWHQAVFSYPKPYQAAPMPQQPQPVVAQPKYVTHIPAGRPSLGGAHSDIPPEAIVPPTTMAPMQQMMPQPQMYPQMPMYPNPQGMMAYGQQPMMYGQVPLQYGQVPMQYGQPQQTSMFAPNQFMMNTGGNGLI